MAINAGNVLFLHSGGVTSVVNAIASQIYKNTKQDKRKLFISRYGIQGLLNNQYRQADDISWDDWRRIAFSPGSSFGSSRLHLPSSTQDFIPLFENFKKHNIRTLFCNGGNNSQRLTDQLATQADAIGYPLQCIGIPKTIDNDILYTDTCPGYGSCAKYTATSVLEMSQDLASMCQSGTQILIYETMGRDTGWIAAASALARIHPSAGPHLILLPEANFTLKQVYSAILNAIKQHHHCVICIAEGATDREQTLSHRPKLYRYISQYLDHLITSTLQLKTHVVIPDYLQRSARHIASLTDIEQSQALANQAYALAKSGKNGIMVTIKNKTLTPYSWQISQVALKKIAGKTRQLPSNFMTQNQLYVTQECIDYITPLIMGESWPTFKNGIPDYSTLIYETEG